MKYNIVVGDRYELLPTHFKKEPQYQLYPVRTQKKPQFPLTPEEIIVQLQNYIRKRKAEIWSMIEIDHEIKADPYDDVARVREVEKIEKIIKNRR